ncbi:hypothetical protein ACN4EK_13125 [Pantanalinema rosaneae CENA516]|uniref:hypothetical protein n=1 Tax=Pantanalinema rosaneae TaxID=1620701 RepID=UPI003D6EE748
MSLLENITDGFYAEQTWRQLQHERHQRFLAQLKAECRAARQQQPLSRNITTSVPTPAASAANGQRHDLAQRNRSRSPIAARPYSRCLM